VKEGKRDLSPTYFLGEFLQQGFSKLSPDEGRVCLNYDATSAAVVNDVPLLTVRVELV
jgi:hypothetical protein